MDNAVSPLASLVIMLDVTPPGQDASIIMPTAISLVMPIDEIMMKATNGRINIRFMIPTKNGFGFRIRL